MSNIPFRLWLGRLANLNAARTASRGIAPHKPLMLLTVIDLIEFGDIPDGWVRYDVRLVSRFRDYWELVLERQRNQPDIPMPFHALGGDKDQVWERSTGDTLQPLMKPRKALRPARRSLGEGGARRSDQGLPHLSQKFGNRLRAPGSSMQRM